MDDSRLTPSKHLGALPPGTQEAEGWLCIAQLLLLQYTLQELLDEVRACSVGTEIVTLEGKGHSLSGLLPC